MKTTNYRQRHFSGDLAFQWSLDQRFSETVNLLKKSGQLSAVADRSAERCIENFIDLLSKGMGNEQALDVVLSMAFNAGPTQKQAA